jgi:hypothetical protein
MKASLVVCLLLVSVLGNDFELLQKMSDYDFGRTILETIQIELSQGDATSAHIVDQLKSMKDATESELTDEESSIASKKAQCANQIEGLQGELLDGNSHEYSFS